MEVLKTHTHTKDQIWTPEQSEQCHFSIRQVVEEDIDVLKDKLNPDTVWTPE